jgi:glycosyltransferase involved in cell wall biosynthesis
MRILQVVHRLYPQNSSGISVYTRALAMEMSGKHAAAVLAVKPCGRDGRTELEKEEVPGGPVIYWLLIPSRFDPARWLKILRIYLKILEEFKPEIVHFQHLISLPFFLPYVTRAKGLRTAIGLHDYWYICPAITLFHRDGYICSGPGYRCAYCVGGAAGPLRYMYRAVKAMLRPFLMRWVLRQADLLLVPSMFVKRKYTAAGFTPSPVLGFKYGSTLPLTGVRGRTEGRLRFGYVGGFRPHKGPEVLLKSFSRLKREAELHMFGWGPPEDIARCRTLSGGDHRVQFHGEFVHEAAREVFSSFDILIMPSIWEETFGIAAQEAFSLGMPVIAADTGGLPEQIEHGVNGFLFKPGDEAALAAMLEHCTLHYKEFRDSLDYKKNFVGIGGAARHMLSVYSFLKGLG